MGGVLIDYIFVYLIRAMIGAVRRLGSKTWPLVTATVDGVCGDVDGAYKSVELLYVYDIDRKMFAGRTSKPFLWSESAKAYVARFPEGSSLKIRVKPGSPERSAVRDSDQIFAQPKEPIVIA